jgi:phage tail sheath protein FI
MEYLAPGVYVEEIDTGAKPIEGVSTSTAGMIGVTERGPVGRPILITSFGEFRRWFGELLDSADFGDHSYLPAGAAGFFTNGGQRVWITRVLRNEATAAAFALRDRGAPGAFAGRLLRVAPRDSGTAVNGPPLTVLDDGTGLAAGDEVRIGDGGNAEYRQIAAAPTATTTIPLAFPLAGSFAQGDPGAGIDRIPDAALGFPSGAGGSFTLTNVAGQSITIQEGAPGDAAVLGGLAPGTLLLLEIGTAPHAEYVFATPTAVAAPDATLDLQQPLLQDYDPAAGVPVVVLDPADPAPAAFSLADAVAAGALVLPVDTPIGAKALVHLDPGGPTQEVRARGSMERLELAGGTFEEYPLGTTLQRVTVADDDREIDTTGGGTRFPVTAGGTDRLVPGMALEVRPAANPPIDVTLTDVDPAAGTITIHPAIADFGANVPVRVVRTLATAVGAGGVSLTLGDRLALQAGDVLRVGAAPADELVVVASLAGDPDPANPGLVLLESPTRRDHAAGDPVALQVVAPDAGVGTAHHVQHVALAAAEGDETVTVSHGGGFAPGDLLEVRRPTGRPFYQELEAAPVALTPVDVLLDREVRRNHGVGEVVVARAPLIDVEALDRGSWGNRLEVAVQDEAQGLVSGAVLTTVLGPTEIEISTLTGVEAGTTLEILDANGDPIGPPVKVDVVNPATGRVELAANLTGAQAGAAGSAVRSREFRLLVRLLRRPDPRNPLKAQEPLEEEEFLNLSMDPRHSRYFERVVGDLDGELRLYDGRPEGNSWLIRVRDVAPSEAVRLGPEALEEVDPRGRTRPAFLRLEGGDDMVALLGDADYRGVDAADPLDRTGLEALRNREDVSIVAAPGRTGTEIQQALVTHCEEMRYRFAILDGPQPPGDTIADVISQRQQFDTKYAALYHPWLLVPHPYPPFPTTEVIEYPVPPSGHLAGIYARVDVERGVHKAPANEVVRGVIGLRQQLGKREQDVLNPGPTNVNVIRDFRRDNRAIRSFGGRVITSDPDWKYVNVRRLVIFIEASIDRGLQWVVFEPNAEPLWARVRRTISDFLTTVWRNGALEGTSPEEAYFVRCDRSTMTQTDIDLGKLIALVGIAPVKPAEFVIIRIGLWTAHAET